MATLKSKFSIINSSIHGKIRKLLIVFENSKEFRGILKELVLKLSPHTQIIICVRSASHKRALINFINNIDPKPTISDLNNKSAKRIDIDKARCVILTTTNSNKSSSVWIRDPFVVLRDDKGQVQIIESAKQKYNMNLAEELLNHKIIDEILVPHRSSDWFKLDGGNILVDEDTIFIGDSKLHELKEIINDDELSIKGKLKNVDKILESLIRKNFMNSTKLKNKRVVFVRNEETGPCNKHHKNAFHVSNIPANLSAKYIGASITSKDKINKVDYLPSELQHIDMFISLTGESINQYSASGKVVGKKKIIIIPKPIAIYPSNTKDANELECRLTEIALIFEQRHNYSVLRNPIPLISKDPKSRSFYLGLYNNCLVERISQKQKTVWLPAYGHASKWKNDLEIYDVINQKIWQKLGYTVKMIIGDFHNYAQGRGGLHCITHELVRN